MVQRRLALIFAACAFVLLPLAVSAQDSGRARIALYQLAGQKDDSTLAAVLSTVADSVELSLDVLQRYDVTRLPAADPSTDLAAVKSYCEAHRVDQAILGSGSARNGGGYDFRLVVYDRRKDSITVDQKGSSSGALDMFDTTDALVASLLDGLSGTHLLFGSLSVETDPAGAIVAVNGKEVGPSPVSLRGLPVGTVQVSARADGRDDASATVTISDGQSSDQSFTLARSMGTLSVKAPADSVVAVRSAEIGEKDLKGGGTLQLPTGDYDVTATDAGLPTVPGKVTIARGQTLPWLPWTKAYLAIEATAPGADVTVDGQDKGPAPEVVEVDPGTLHRVSVKAAHYRTFVADLAAARADKTVFDAALAPNPGSIKVVTSIPGVDVTLDDGKQKGTSPAVFNDVPAGPHVIALGTITSNNKIFTGGTPSTVNVTADEQALVSLTLQPGLGHLRIVSAPEGSTVQVDGKSAEAVVLTQGIDVPAGQMDVTVTGPNTQKWTQTINIAVNGDERIPLSSMDWHLPHRTIRLGTADDWQGLVPTWIPVHQLGFPAQPGTDMVRGFAARDDGLLYVRFEFANGRPRVGLVQGIDAELQYMASIGTTKGEVQAKVRFQRIGGASSLLGLWDPVTSRWRDFMSGFKYQIGDNSLDMAIPLAAIRSYLGGDLIELKLLVLDENSSGTWLNSIQTDQRQVSFDLENIQSSRLHVPVIAKGLRGPFWQSVMKGALAAGQQYGLDVSFDGPETEADVQPQVKMLQNELAKNPAAICLAALDTRAVTAALREAALKHIPVIGLDSGVPGAPSGDIYATAATDNRAAGALAAEKLFGALKDRIAVASDSNPVEIVVLSQDATSQSIQDRGIGFRDRLIRLITSQTAHPAADIAVTGNPAYVAADSPTAGKAIVIDMEVAATARMPDVASAAGAVVGRAARDHVIGIFCSNQAAVEGLLNATKGGASLPSQHAGLTVVGFDAGRAQKLAVRDRYLLGSVTQDPYQIGFKAVELANKALQKEPAADVDTGARFYDSTSMNQPDIQQLLYD